MENGAMELLHRIAHRRAIARRESRIHESLACLDSRALGDLGVVRDEIRAVARLGARVGPEGVHLKEVVRQLRADQAEPGEWTYHAPSALDRRDDATAAAPRSQAPRSGMAGLAARVGETLAGTTIGRRIQLQLLWHRAYRQVRRELESYSPRELMADLRLSSSEIDDIAAEGADERVARFVAAEPAFRRAAFARRQLAA
jgi:uncharacterized protein YjiS (DUF1127 family)